MWNIASKNKKPQPIIIIFGPTAVGKTDLLLNLFNSDYEIINADSRQIYRYMDIGTAKPSKIVLKQLHHHLINIIDPSKQFNAGRFVKLTDKLIIDIIKNKKIPIIAGGTVFYIKNFIFGLPNAPISNPHIRKELKDKFKKQGIKKLYTELEEIDPVTAKRIGKQDKYRIIRALEVFKNTGKPLSSFNLPFKKREQYTYKLIGLYRERTDLYKRIDKRVDWMFDNGLITEIKRLLAMGYNEKDPGMKSIGYKEFFFMQKTCHTFSAIKDIIKTNTRKYAKRQITFFKHLPEAVWYYPKDLNKIRNEINNFIEQNQS